MNTAFTLSILLQEGCAAPRNQMHPNALAFQPSHQCAMPFSTIDGNRMPGRRVHF